MRLGQDALTAEQKARIEADARELAERRAQARWRPIMDNRRPAEGEVNCAGCDHLCNFDDESRRGWCMWLRRLCSTWHPVMCSAFKPLARERVTKIVWQGVVYE